MRSLFAAAMLLVCLPLLAQQNSLYQAISYQAVARDANGDPVANQTIGLEFLITAGPGGVYQETQTTTTNDQGLFTVNIGEGTPSGFGPLEEFTWYHPANDLRLFVSADFTGGTNYQFFGEEIIRAVPVAATARMATTLLDSSVVVDRDNGLIEVDPAYDLLVNGSLTYQDGNEGAGRVLVSDASGTASWQDPQETVIHQVDNGPAIAQPKSPDYVLELSAAWPDGNSLVIPATILDSYCADMNGCRLTLTAENAVNDWVEVKMLSLSYEVGSGTYVYNYGTNVNTGAFGGNALLASGVNNGCQIHGGSWSGYVVSNGDSFLHLAKLSNLVTRCAVKVED
ncbi:MAG: hypothetical protein H6593_05620 [Flavobacteriales bacterium]|nr:hypothetical protein [Flavobacteriales bacterium]